jgi:hypothetical protein
LTEIGRTDLVSLISSHGGFRAVREKLGFDPLKIENKWNIDNVIAFARTLITKHEWNTLPGSKVLGDLGYGPFVQAVKKYHGSIRVVRDIVGVEQIKVEYGKMQDLDFVIDLWKIAMEEIGSDTLPSGGILTANGYGSLANSIISYHGGFRKLRLALGEDPKQREIRMTDVQARDFHYVLNYGEQVLIDNQLEELPSGRKLRVLGHPGLVTAAKYYGGLPALRGFLREYMGVESKEDKLRNMLEEYVGGCE